METNEIKTLLSKQHRNTRHKAIDILLDAVMRNPEANIPQEFIDDVQRDIMNMKQESPLDETITEKTGE